MISRPSTRRRLVAGALALCWIMGQNVLAPAAWAHDFMMPGGSSPGGPGGPNGGNGPGGEDGGPTQPAPNNPAGGDGDSGGDTEPLDLSLGEYFLTRQDVYMVGRGLPMDITFTYRSHNAFNGPFGYGWGMSYHERLRKLDNNNVVWLRGGNRQDEFAYAGPGTFTAPTGIYFTLTQDGSGNYQLISKHGFKRFFDATGKLTRIEDRNANALIFAYDPAGLLPVIGKSAYFVNQVTGVIARDYRLTGMTDATGRVITFTYNGEGRVAGITYGGRTITYQYAADSSGDLTRVTWPATPEFPSGSTTSYAYTNHNLETITDANGQVYLTNEYDANDFVIEQVYGNGTNTITYDHPPVCPSVPGSGAPGFSVSLTPREGTAPGDPFTVSWTAPEGQTTTSDWIALYQRSQPDNHYYETYVYTGGETVGTAQLSTSSSAIETQYEARYLAEGGYDTVMAVSSAACLGAAPLVPGPITTAHVTNRNGVVAQYDFDIAGHITRMERFTDGTPVGEPGAYITQHEYNAEGQRTRVLYPRGNSIKYTYDAQGNMLEMRRKAIGLAPGVPDPSDLVTTYTYEPQFNFIKTVTDPRGNTTTYTYDYELSEPAKGNLRRITWPVVDAQTIQATVTYNSFGQLDTVTDPNGFVTKYTYHPTSGYPTQVTRGFGTAQAASMSFARDAVGNIISITDPRSNVTTLAYNNRNQLTQVTAPSPLSFQTRYRYNANGNLRQIDRQNKTTTPGAQPALGTTSPTDDWQSTVYAYTVRDEVASITDDLNHATSFTYDGTGNLKTATDAKSQTTAYNYDERNLLTTITDAGSPAGVITYAYDSNGNLAARRDAENRETGYEYDNFDRVERMVYADGSDEEYGYDAASDLTSLITPANQSMAYTYDALNRLRIKVTPEETTTYTYDVGSRLTAAVDADVSLAYVYDALNRVTQVTTDPIGALAATTVSYLYDAASNRTRLTYPDASFITYTYDQLNRLDLIRNSGGATIADFGFDALSRRSSLNLANGVNTAYTYDAASRLTQLTSSVATRTYTFDNIDQPLTMVDTTGTHTYGYNPRNELTTVDHPAAFSFADAAFTYDKAGNRTQVSQGGVTAYTPNVLNQYANVGGVAMTHDANGNLTSDGMRSYTFDSQNRLLTATGGGNTSQYTYDPLGRRVSKTVNGTTTRFLYDGPEILTETNGAGAMQGTYVFGPGLDHPLRMVRGAATHYFHADRLGSIIALSTSAGAVAETCRYDTFGRPATTSTLGNRFLFTGREYDPETGLYYYRARYHDPRLGRFVSRDPLGYLPDEHLYRYVGNSPTMWVDPEGLTSVPIFGESVPGSFGPGMIGDPVSEGGSGFIFDPPAEFEPGFITTDIGGGAGLGDGGGSLDPGGLGGDSGPGGFGGGLGDQPGTPPNSGGYPQGDSSPGPRGPGYNPAESGQGGGGQGQEAPGSQRGHRKGKSKGKHDKHTRPRSGDPERGDIRRPHPPKRFGGKRYR